MCTDEYVVKAGHCSDSSLEVTVLVQLQFDIAHSVHCILISIYK